MDTQIDPKTLRNVFARTFVGKFPTIAQMTRDHLETLGVGATAKDATTVLVMSDTSDEYTLNLMFFRAFLECLLEEQSAGRNGEFYLGGFEDPTQDRPNTP